MIDVPAIKKAKQELERLNYRIDEANRRITELTKKDEACRRWAREKVEEVIESPLSSHLGKMELAMYYAKAAEEARSDIEGWEKLHCDALAQLRTAAVNYDEVREGLPEDIDQRVEIMDKYGLEWFFTADRWVIDPLNCSLETFEMLCDLQRRTNDALWEHFCKGDYELESEDVEEIPLQWQRDRIANAEAFLWSYRIDADWYAQVDFEELALETPVAEFQDRLWDFFDEAREEGDRLEAEPEPVVSVDVGDPSNTFTIYYPNTDLIKVFSPPPISPQTTALYYGEEPGDLVALAEKYEELKEDLGEPSYVPYKDWEAVVEAAQKARDRLNERLSPWLLQRKLPNKASPYTDYTELAGVKKREGVTFEEVEGWVKENSAQIPGLDSSSEMDMEKLFKALFGRES